MPTEDTAPKDKSFRKYASGVDRALALFDTTLQEWADYISFLNRLLKVRAPPPPVNKPSLVRPDADTPLRPRLSRHASPR